MPNMRVISNHMWCGGHYQWSCQLPRGGICVRRGATNNAMKMKKNKKVSLCSVDGYSCTNQVVKNGVCSRPTEESRNVDSI